MAPDLGDALVHHPPPTFRARGGAPLPAPDARPRVVPTFLVLGAAKCGTTSMYHLLRQHPQVCMSDPKEPFFFEAEYERGLAYYAHAYFAHWSGQPAVGECRHRNLYLPFVPRRVKESLPDARFVVMVRDPVERAYSDWWHFRSRGREPLGFAAAVERDLRRLREGPSFDGAAGARLWAQRLDPHGVTGFGTYVDSGHYAEQIQRYVDLFGRERVLIVFAEDFALDRRAVVEEVFRFVGVEPVTLPDYSTQNRARREDTSVSSAGLAWRRAVMRLPLPLGARRAVRDRTEGWFRVTKPPLRDATRRMLAEHYRPHNERLEKMTGRDLPGWGRAGETPPTSHRMASTP